MLVVVIYVSGESSLADFPRFQSRSRATGA